MKLWYSNPSLSRYHSHPEIGFPGGQDAKSGELVKFEFDRICFQILEWDDMERHIFVRMACPKKSQNQHCRRLETLCSGSQKQARDSSYIAKIGIVIDLSYFGEKVSNCCSSRTDFNNGGELTIALGAEIRRNPRFRATAIICIFVWIYVQDNLSPIYLSICLSIYLIPYGCWAPGHQPLSWHQGIKQHQVRLKIISTDVWQMIIDGWY